MLLKQVDPSNVPQEGAAFNDINALLGGGALNELNVPQGSGALNALYAHNVHSEESQYSRLVSIFIFYILYFIFYILYFIFYIFIFLY